MLIKVLFLIKQMRIMHHMDNIHKCNQIVHMVYGLENVHHVIIQNIH